MLRTSGARFLFTVTDFLDTDYVALLDEAGARDLVEEIVILEGSGAARHRELGRLPGARRGGRRRRGRDARGGARPATRCATSSSPRARPGAPKGAMLRHGASVRAYASWADVVGLRHGDRYLLVYPLFHTAGSEVGPGRVAAHRHDAAPPPRVRHAVGDGHGAGGAASRCSRARRRSTRPSSTPTSRSTTSRRCASRSPAPRSSRSSWWCRCASSSGSSPWSPATASPRPPASSSMCRHDDDPEIIAHTSGRPIPGVEMKIVDADGNEVPDRRAGRDRRPRLPGDDRLLRQPRGDRRDHRRRRLAAHRRRRATSTARTTSPSPTASRTCSSSAGSTRTRPRSRA